MLQSADLFCDVHLLIHSKQKMAKPDRSPDKLRSHRWFGPDDLRSFGHRSRLKGMGLDDGDYLGKPVIGLLNTWSDLNTCHSHFRERAEEIKRGIYQSGGFPVEVPVMSLGEMLMKPTTMLYRNLLAMEVEEVLRCHPIDAAVLMGGCDKTTPALMMGAISSDMTIPIISYPCWSDAESTVAKRHPGQRKRRLEILGRTPGRESMRQGHGKADRELLSDASAGTIA